MDNVQLVIAIIAIFGMFLWNRTEARNDLREFRSEIKDLVNEIQKEMKDFHGRLCALEEKNRGK